MMIHHRIKQVLCVSFTSLLIGLLSITNTFAADRSITLNDGQHIQLKMPIGKVFISNPDIADYKIINDNTLVVFANGIGQSRLIVYGTDDDVLLSDRIIVDLDLSEVRRQLKFHFPDAKVKVQSVGEQVAVSGVVDSEETRDDIYRMVATLLGREKTEKWEKVEKLEFKSDYSDYEEPESMVFARNMTWKGIIERIKVATTQQVNVKISVAQVNESFSKTVGVDWSSIGSKAGEFVFDQFDAANLSTLITALGDDQVAEVLAEPNLTVLSGESASFLVGGEVPVIVSNNNNVNISFKEFGIKLDLTAKVLSQDKIRMQLAPEVSEVESYVEAAGIKVPQLSSRRAMTTVELADGDSFILGGLMSSADLEKMQKIPFIGDIPVLGAAFRKATTERKRTELIIVATVNLVEPIKPKDIQLPHIKKTSTLARWLNIDSDDNSNTSSDATIRLLSEGGFIQ
ncbi:MULTISPECIES: type II and III secretion system protein family protein [Vibrio]|jgi:pilus assembly protein CpaC|uniref:type II and III secretion system protein family protein n=1 Tax=Vibrio TaxID=662 RepID=UPI00040B026F|nr:MULTISPECIES: pilus assembly protein N-terminal domain-containing protein [Vibrio]EKO3799399.1 pilus assembly protein N-terminal domain-containing protein [Vibrio harveyi]EKO3811453.1 pilus assembly protein N-terminal domain-containing protein [Vibrio harveyi]EKO3815770.1 pilus assembly protein N-terminal domain-containing protein [Vibrio harveyi]EKO3823224.1 pilus assembly protein N-terminal domain-containing protein [Vibrio harveyi]EKO3838806.1 pilus assembly protein N-terminal domain-con